MFIIIPQPLLMNQTDNFQNQPQFFS